MTTPNATRRKGPSKGALVSLVIVNWNSREFLPGCIRTSLAQTHRNVEVIVVDNASTDGSPRMVRNMFPRAKFPQVKLLACRKNLGYCGEQPGDTG